VSATVFFEGGGDKEATQSRCREGLSNYCAKLKPPSSRLRIVAGGGREQTFDKFRTAALDGRSGEVFALLVDSEGPVSANTPAEHLRVCDGWDFTGLLNHKVFLMVQAMEAWFLADRDALATFYDGGFLAKRLPGSLETNRRLQQQLELLKNNPLYIERVSRDRLNLGRPGEVIFRFDPYQQTTPGSTGP